MLGYAKLLFIDHLVQPWTLIALASAYRVYYGDVMALHAIADIKKGEEISLSYSDPTQAFDGRAKQLKGLWDRMLMPPL